MLNYINLEIGVMEKMVLNFCYYDKEDQVILNLIDFHEPQTLSENYVKHEEGVTLFIIILNISL